MKRGLLFFKMVASGNDFVLLEQSNIKGAGLKSLSSLARQLCDRKHGVGADGVLLLKRIDSGTAGMRIFNADGTEAEMCGNGARCAALFWARKTGKRNFRIRALAGELKAEVCPDLVKVQLTDPCDYRKDISLEMGSRKLHCGFINTGVPHAVIFVSDLENTDVFTLGRLIRNHDHFAPCGSNVDFVQVRSCGDILVRTYERGVEDETLACGTGSVASAIITNLRFAPDKKEYKVRVLTRGKERLTVFFSKHGDSVNNVWLAGEARMVYGGKYYLK